MNADIVNEINNLVLEYKRNHNSEILKEIQIKLKLLEYQTWLLKYDVKIIEDTRLKIGNDDELKIYEKMFSHSNAFSKYHLIIPLMLYLLAHHRENQPALTTSLSFMNKCKEFLKEGDFAKTKTGVQRFITNTRFASLELRKFGLLRSDYKHYYHTWELSLFGILIAGCIYYDFKNNLAHYFFKNHFSNEKAYESFLLILKHYIEQLLEYKKFREILDSILEEEVIMEFLELYEKNFLQFAKTVNLVIENGYKPKEDSTKKLIKLINSINADREISKLADSIILKKDIEINMEYVYNLLNLRKKNNEDTLKLL